ncbi:MAG: hypoxanthine phosphoribosyltransferase [candidate division Zixibacteria bacterium]|nr:hypoxanthine phosphoribosyltransferase [candidate division Zixibacteria bacterium]
MDYKGNVDRVLYDRDILAERVAEVGRQIKADFAGKDLVVVAVLKGAFVFAADLIRAVDLPMAVDFAEIISYGEGTETTEEVVLTKDVGVNVKGRDVLVVEDIVDTGLTTAFLVDHLRIRDPRRVDVCALLYKPAKQRVEVPLRYVCFEVGDVFAVGYGLDYAGRYRNLPEIVTLKELEREE